MALRLHMADVLKSFVSVGSSFTPSLTGLRSINGYGYGEVSEIVEISSEARPPKLASLWGRCAWGRFVGVKGLPMATVGVQMSRAGLW